MSLKQNKKWSITEFSSNGRLELIDYICKSFITYVEKIVKQQVSNLCLWYSIFLRTQGNKNLYHAEKQTYFEPKPIKWISMRMGIAIYFQRPDECSTNNPCIRIDSLSWVVQICT